MFREIKKNSIPLLLMNARITNKSFTKWSFFKNFSKDTFAKIDIAYPANTETLKYLKKFNVKKIKNIGNLKFTDDKDSSKNTLTKSFLLKLKKRLIWVASSTHPSEEVLVGKTHLELSKRFKKLLTIILYPYESQICYKQIQNKSYLFHKLTAMIIDVYLNLEDQVSS